MPRMATVVKAVSVSKSRPVVAAMTAYKTSVIAGENIPRALASKISCQLIHPWNGVCQAKTNRLCCTTPSSI
jgi:hypothetical protein